MGPQRILKTLVLTAASLYLTTIIIPGFSIQPGLRSITITTLVFTALNVFIKPLLKLLLLPVNLITLGAFRWLVNIILLYLLTLVAPQVSITGFSLSAIPLIGSLLPTITLARFFSTVAISIVLSFSQSLLLWLIK